MIFRLIFILSLAISSELYSQGSSVEKKSSIEELHQMLASSSDSLEIAALSVKIYRTYKFESLTDGPDEVAYLMRALRIYEDIKDWDNAAYVYNSLAGMHYNRGQMEDAKSHWQKAIELYEKSGNQARLGVMYNNISLAYQDTTEAARAIRKGYLEKAIEIYLPLEDSAHLSSAYLNLGSLYRDGYELTQAEKYYGKALDLAHFLDRRNTIQAAMLHIGILRKMQGRLPEAVEAIEESLSYNAIRDTDPNVLRAREELAELYDRKGDYRNAHANLKAFTKAQKELFEVEKMEQLLALEAQYNTEKKEQEIELLKEREVIQAKALAAEQQVKNYLAMIGIISIMGLIVIGVLYQKSKKRAAEIAAQKVELEQLNATKDRFFGIIAHDLRNPVISFQGIARLIDSYLKKGKMDKIERLSEKIQHSVNNLNQLLDNLLNWASSQTSALPYHPEPLPITQIIDEAISLFSDTADAKQIDIANNVNNDIVIYADRNGVSTIFRNLINNALKFTPEEGKIDIAAELDGDMVKIVTTDNGVGIDLSKISSLFQLSNEKSTEGTSGEKGTGLGLVLCQEFAKVNKGLIWVESELRKGSSFYVSMPKYTA